MAMKFPSDRDDIVTVRGKGLESKLYYLESLKIAKTTSSHEHVEPKGEMKKDSKCKQKFVRRDSVVVLIDLDPR
jgi:hypothetical protein